MRSFSDCSQIKTKIKNKSIMAEKKRLTIYDFVEKNVAKYSKHVFLREKVNGVWTETTFEQTMEEARIYAAGFMALGLGRGEKVSLISEGRNQWIFSELGVLFAGAVNVPLSFKLESDMDITFRINHSDSRFVIASQTQIEKVRRIIGQCPAVEKVIVMDDIELHDNEIYLSDIRKMGAEFLKETLNEQQRKFMKRSRPKILLATNLDDAMAMYEKYKSNLLGVISVVGFTESHRLALI